jgi:hypothetical protein
VLTQKKMGSKSLTSIRSDPRRTYIGGDLILMPISVEGLSL